MVPPARPDRADAEVDGARAEHEIRAKRHHAGNVQSAAHPSVRDQHHVGADLGAHFRDCLHRGDCRIELPAP